MQQWQFLRLSGSLSCACFRLRSCKVSCCLQKVVTTAVAGLPVALPSLTLTLPQAASRLCSSGSPGVLGSTYPCREPAQLNVGRIREPSLHQQASHPTAIAATTTTSTNNGTSSCIPMHPLAQSQQLYAPPPTPLWQNCRSEIGKRMQGRESGWALKPLEPYQHRPTGGRVLPEPFPEPYFEPFPEPFSEPPPSQQLQPPEPPPPPQQQSSPL